jgi:2'-5' RNA ligase
LTLATLAVVAYPNLAERDRRWVESIRARHDPQAARLNAHFTCVFPATLSAPVLVEHVSVVLARFRTIRFVIRRAIAFRDPLAGNSHVFLVPDEGREELIALHDGLYGDTLQIHLRHDIPFEPHMTVATLDTFEACEGLAHAMNGAFPAIPGVVNAVDVVEVGPAAVVRTLRTVPLEASR